ncbi:MAG: DUF262 domain-containing protein [Methylobacter sp.]|nr:DUF262 domain-containing protein [Methylobacter sp.]
MNDMIDEEDDDLKFSDESEGEDKEEVIDGIPKEQRVLRTQAYDKSISDIIGMIKEKDITLNPEYQRNYVWDNKKASLLVESILLNVPIPVVYVAEAEDNSWTVVDGLQRLNSLRRFFDNEFKLRGLEVLPELNGIQYSTLNPKAARIIKNGILRVILIFKESHPEIKYDIFMRLNRGAIKLTEQELRNCLYRGKLNDLLMELRKNKAFLGLIGLTEPHKRMADAELILRYFAFTTNYNQSLGQVVNYSGKVKNTLNRYCDQLEKMTDSDVARLTSKFKDTVEKIQLTLGNTAFQRINKDNTTDGRLNRAIMDCVMLSFERHEKQKLVDNKDKIRSLLRDLPINDQGFSDAISYGTADKKRLEYRLNTWHKNLTSLLG